MSNTFGFSTDLLWYDKILIKAGCITFVKNVFPQSVLLVKNTIRGPKLKLFDTDLLFAYRFPNFKQY